MERSAEELKKFEDADVPILWRPFHESDGTWFWWGAKGPEVARELSCTPWAYYMTWSKEFCIGEKFNSVENLKSMYASEYAIKAEK